MEKVRGTTVSEEQNGHSVKLCCLRQGAIVEELGMTVTEGRARGERALALGAICHVQDNDLELMSYKLCIRVQLLALQA